MASTTTRDDGPAGRDRRRERHDADGGNAGEEEARGDAGEERGGGRRLLATGVCTGVLGLGVLGYFAVGWIADEPEPREPGPRGPLVEVERVRAVDTLSVAGTGFVRAAETLSVSAEVSGRVSRVSEDFRVGRRLAAGAVVVELDRTRFEADVEIAEARVIGARARLDTARANAARQHRLDADGFAVDQRLDEVEATLASAEAELALAAGERKLARIALEDAVLTAPYDALVSERRVSVGQIVGPGTSVGELVTADRAEIRIGLLPRQRELLEPDGALVGREVDVFAVARNRDGAAREPLARGRVAAIDPVLDPVTRTLGLVVDVNDPFSRDALRVGELVEVVVPVPGTARTIHEVSARALKGADRLWIVDDGTLRAVDPIVVRRDGARVQLASDALAAGDEVLVTDIATAVEGLSVRVRRDDEGGREDEEGGGENATGAERASGDAGGAAEGEEERS